MIDPAVLKRRDRYQRVVDAWIDNTHEDALTHTVRLSDDDRAVELTAVATPWPGYEIKSACCRVLRGVVAPSVAAGVGRLAGARMVAGFTRRAGEAVGTAEGADFIVDAAIEVARLARQVAKMPREVGEQAATADPEECWRLDTAACGDVRDSCFTFTEAGRALLGTRPVTTPAVPDLYSPRPGQRRVFVRKKVARVERAGDRLRLVHSMHDNLHGFDITYELEAGSGRIVKAEHVTPRLPYMGICNEPQARIRALIGERVDAGLRKRIGEHIGGTSGCAQLYDLTADLLKLLA